MPQFLELVDLFIKIKEVEVKFSLFNTKKPQFLILNLVVQKSLYIFCLVYGT